MEKNKTNEIAQVNMRLNESELCFKIQKLTDNIKNHYNKDMISNSVEICKDNNAHDNNKNTSNYVIKYDTESISTMSQEKDGIVTISDNEDSLHYNMGIKHVNGNNGCAAIQSVKVSNCCQDHISKPSSNLIPELTLTKIQTLEQLIIVTNQTLRDTTANQCIRKRLSELIDDFRVVKLRIELGTKSKLTDNEILALMKTLKELFDNFYSIQKDINDLRTDVCQSSQHRKSVGYCVDYPLRPSRGNNALTISCEKVSAPTATANSQNFQNHPNGPYQTGRSVLDVIQLKQKTFPLSKDSMRHAFLNINDNNNLNLYKLEMTQSNIKSVNNAVFETNKNGNDIEKIQDEIRVTTNSPFNLAKNSFILNKSSKLPVLRKDNTNDHRSPKDGEISCLSQTIAKQVFNNLQQIGYYSTMRPKPEVARHCRSKSDGLVKPSKIDRKAKDINQSLVKEEDRLVKSRVASLYLTKLGNTRCKNWSSVKQARNSTSRIFCLETLLLKNKYKFVDENKLTYGKQSVNINKSIVHINGSIYYSDLQNGDTKELGQQNDGTDLTMLLSLSDNSIKIVHQIVIFPTTVFEESSCENITKNPRLVHIENICSCKIIVLNRKETLIRKIRPDKQLKVIEIHYDLRKGKALGCINMLRQLTASMTQTMKIYRSTVLLPGGYLKEMSACSISELLNLSNQASDNINIVRSRMSSKLKPKIRKRRENITKPVSLSCLDIS